MIESSISKSVAKVDSPQVRKFTSSHKKRLWWINFNHTFANRRLNQELSQGILYDVWTHFQNQTISFSRKIKSSIWHNPEVTVSVSGEITNFQKDLLFKEHSWRRRFSSLLSILSIVVSVISYFHIWNKIRKSVWQHTVLGKCFLNNSLVFLD